MVFSKTQKAGFHGKLLRGVLHFWFPWRRIACSHSYKLNDFMWMILQYSCYSATGRTVILSYSICVIKAYSSTNDECIIIMQHSFKAFASAARGASSMWWQCGHCRMDIRTLSMNSSAHILLHSKKHVTMLNWPPAGEWSYVLWLPNLMLERPMSELIQYEQTHAKSPSAKKEKYRCTTWMSRTHWMLKLSRENYAMLLFMFCKMKRNWRRICSGGESQ